MLSLTFDGSTSSSSSFGRLARGDVRGGGRDAWQNNGLHCMTVPCKNDRRTEVAKCLSNIVDGMEFVYVREVVHRKRVNKD